MNKSIITAIVAISVTVVAYLVSSRQSPYEKFIFSDLSDINCTSPMFKEAFEEILSFEEYPSNIHFLEGANLQDIENIHSYKSEKFRISLSRAQQIYGSGRNGLYLNTAQEMADSELRYTLVCSVNVSSSARIYSDKIFFSRPSEEVETGNEIYIARDLDQIFTFLSEENSAPENSGSDLLPPASKN